MAFWGQVIEPGKPFVHTHNDNRGRLRLSKATLGDITKAGEENLSARSVKMKYTCVHFFPKQKRIVHCMSNVPMPHNEEGDDDPFEYDKDEGPIGKPQSRKKRQHESATKTHTSNKKAKMSTPQKTDGKKAAVHVATSHLSKKPDAKNKSNQQSPVSADGTHVCELCKSDFKTPRALEAHKEDKHMSKKKERRFKEKKKTEKGGRSCW
ncbi:histone deacetylase HDT1 [Tanacetum coccineum]